MSLKRGVLNTVPRAFLWTVLMTRPLLILIVLFLCSCSEPDISYPHRSMPADLSQNSIRLATAQHQFIRHCANCHGTLSEGRMSRAGFFQPPAPDFSAPFYSQADPAYLFWRISDGKTVEPYLSQGSVMPPWGAHFSDAEIWQLVAYLQSRSHP